MTTLADFTPESSIKMMIAADSGSGKTGSLASLVDAGYKLRILDFEAKLDPIVGHIKDRSKLVNVDYKTLKDEFKLIGTTMTISKATSFQQAMSALNQWDKDLGAVQTWSTDTILVIDAFSSMGRAALNMVLMANGRINKPPEIQDWGAAMDMLEKVLMNLTNPKLVPCHLIVLTHLTSQESADGLATRTYPESLGTKLNPRVAKYFNNLIGLKATAASRKFKTKAEGLLACKTHRPIKDEYPIETGLADIFRDLLKS